MSTLTPSTSGKKNWQTRLALVALVLALGGLSWTLWGAFKSQLFTLDSIEMSTGETLTRAAPMRGVGLPLDPAEIQERAGVEVGKASLMALSLSNVEHRILKYGWVREVHLRKKLPGTLVIEPIAREPIAFYQSSEGMLSYIDRDGTVFGPVDLSIQSDLPVLSGFDGADTPVYLSAIEIIKEWPGGLITLSGLNYETSGKLELGIASNFYSTIEWSQHFDRDQSADIKIKIHRLGRVLAYLQSHSIKPGKIVFEGGGDSTRGTHSRNASQKIVVKTARRS